MKSIVNSEILGVHEFEGFTHAPYPNSDFSIGRVVNPTNVLRNFSENLLLYDKIYVVTSSFEEVITLKKWLGGHLLQELLHDKVIHFIQMPFSWAYIQRWKQQKGLFKTYGIVTVSIADEKFSKSSMQRGTGDIPLESLGGWSSTDLEKAVTYTLTKFHEYNPKKIGKFARLVAGNSTQLRSDPFRRFITNKSMEDLQNKAVLKSLNIPEDIDIENIPDNSPEIRKVLSVIMANQDLAVMNSFPDADLLAEKFYMEALRFPLTNELRKTKYIKQAENLFSLEKLPIPEILGTTLSIGDIIKLRNSKDGEKFRKWIQENMDNSENVQAAYVELLKRKPPFLYRLINTIVSPLLSLGFTAITKVPGFVADAAIGGVMEFKVNSLVERYLAPNPPKIFMEKLTSIEAELKKEE